MRSRRLLPLLLGLSPPTHAYCRATTCDGTETPSCAVDASGCVTEGEPLAWPTLCVTFAVAASVPRDPDRAGLGAQNAGLIDASAVQASAEAAFQRWSSVACPGGGVPSLGVVSLGQVRCDRVEFNGVGTNGIGGPNANLIVVRDDWAAAEQELFARTTLTFDGASGAILDADIELNARALLDAAEGPSGMGALDAVLTHEAGLFLGLDESSTPGASLAAGYDPADPGYISLAEDDQAAMCAAYPPGDAAVDICPSGTGPNYGFSRDCGPFAAPEGGCSLGGSSAGFARESTSSWIGALWGATTLLVTCGLTLRRRLRAR